MANPKPRDASPPPQVTGARWIPLTRERFALVDDADYEQVSRHNWCVDIRARVEYAVAYIDGRNVMLHRFLLGISDRSTHVDHRDSNGLNNRRSNLRLATASQNARNARKLKRLSSNFKGVSRKKNKWRASIMLPGKVQRSLGTFESEADAAAAYDLAARQLFGEFARTNQ